jgi:hypothetical protein
MPLPKKHANRGRPFVITKHDTNYLAYVPSKIVVVTGTVKVELSDGTLVTLPDVGAKQWTIDHVVRVLSTGTTATNIVGIT